MPDQSDHQLLLVKATKSQGGQWAHDDYDVRDRAGKVVGRIMLHPQAPKDRPWFWTITAHKPQTPTDRGYATTREVALAAFRAAWARRP
jgi:hypothetical protein